MRFTKIYIPRELYANGINDISMDRLNQIVVLVGKNGSGKTRILNSLNKFSNEYYTLDSEGIMNLKGNINNKKLRIERLKEMNKEKSLSESEKLIKKLEDEVFFDGKKLFALLNSETIKQQDSGRSNINFIPKKTSMEDPVSLSMTELKLSSIRLTLGNIDNLSDLALPIIQSVQNKYQEATRDDFKDLEEKSKAIKEYNNLKYWIKELLGVELDRDDDGNASLFDFNIGGAKLSDGQSVLIQLCVLLYKQGKNLNNNIISLDEPENHIHPAAIIEALKKIIDVTKESQIWIATHSVPLIAYLASLQETSIWYVEDGKVSFAGSSPEKVLEGLLGNEEQIKNLHDFIGLPAQYAINQYAYQCLFASEAVMTDSGDPQTTQIKEVLNNLAKGRSLKLLDYGAGRGRLLANILETDIELLKKVEYVAYDKFDKNKEQCEGIIKSAYGDSTNKYFNSMAGLKAVHRESFDVILLCNVLHEIPPQEWVSLFQNDLSNLLNENGVILIVEDSQIPIGEKAHQHGFIVFDEPQIRELFTIRGEATDFISQPYKNNPRLKAHLISKKYILNITENTKKEALKSLNGKAKEEIERLRALPPESITYKQGREHAFWVQQFANTLLALG